MRRTQILLPHRVLEAMKREARRRYPNESGGVLLGYRDVGDSRLIQVLDQIGPGPRAVHKPRRFEPDAEWQAERVASAYADSGRIATYLGDWHSHPRGFATPSELDRSTAREIARYAAARAPNPLIVILHGKPGAWNIAAHRRGRWRLRPIRVTLT